MQTRSTELSTFLRTLHSAIIERASPQSDAYRTTTKIMQALTVERTVKTPEPVWLPPCEYLTDAVDNIAMQASQQNEEIPSNTSDSLVEHARALLDIAPMLTWWHRTADVEPASPFAHAHANATLIGRGGLEERDDVWVGISLMSPGIEYPQHNHPPEEVYLVMSPGHWQQNAGEWFEPGIGGLVHNTPNILHAMRSGSAPLLATWCLCTG